MYTNVSISRGEEILAIYQMRTFENLILGQKVKNTVPYSLVLLLPTLFSIPSGGVIQTAMEHILATVFIKTPRLVGQTIFGVERIWNNFDTAKANSYHSENEGVESILHEHIASLANQIKIVKKVVDTAKANQVVFCKEGKPTSVIPPLQAAVIQEIIRTGSKLLVLSLPFLRPPAVKSVELVDNAEISGTMDVLSSEAKQALYAFVRSKKK